MTAGRSAGTEQGQGREVWRIGKHYGIHVYAGDRPVATFLDADDADLAVRAYNASPSVPPARDSGRDEAREAVARWIHGLGLGYHWSDGDAYRLKLADQVLSLPAVAALLRDGTTT